MIDKDKDKDKEESKANIEMKHWKFDDDTDVEEERVSVRELWEVSFQRVEWSSTQKQIEMKEKILLLLGDHKVRAKTQI